MNIQHIFSGYVILMAVIGSMTAILLFDYARIKEIEEESTEIRSVRRDINPVHRRITGMGHHGVPSVSRETHVDRHPSLSIGYKKFRRYSARQERQNRCPKNCNIYPEKVSVLATVYASGSRPDKTTKLADDSG